MGICSLGGTVVFQVRLCTPLRIMGLSLSRLFVEFFLKHVYSIIVGENFQVHDVKITGKCICESKKIESIHFDSCVGTD